ncbi:hypothetical protein GCM10009710_15640 [Aeromicrobium alkaliterrae]|uniref:Uncharacterized protein n=1 Tax=Aeromicrobium alkaliterrae TaxID=302168 RepID=A0ABN2JRA6_9ACTN
MPSERLRLRQPNAITYPTPTTPNQAREPVLAMRSESVAVTSVRIATTR